MKYNGIYNEPVARSCVTHPWCYWDEGFTDAQLNDVMDYSEQFVFTPATISSTSAEKDLEQIERVRKSKIVWLKPNADTQWIFDKINWLFDSVNSRFYGYNLSGYDSIQYTIYNSEEGGNYDWHMDMFPGEYTGHGETRKLSMTLLLNDDFEGGQFEINTGNHNKPIVPELKKGRAIFFPSYMIHRVAPVTKGVRKSMVVWCLGPKFS